MRILDIKQYVPTADSLPCISCNSSWAKDNGGNVQGFVFCRECEELTKCKQHPVYKNRCRQCGNLLRFARIQPGKTCSFYGQKDHESFEKKGVR